MILLVIKSSLSPEAAHERHLFDLALSAAWNLRRAIGLEALLQNEANSLGFAGAFFDEEPGKELDCLNRYKRQYETTCRRAFAELCQLIAARRESAAPSLPK